MKKILLLSLALILGVGAFAQKHYVKPELGKMTVELKKGVYGNDVNKDAMNFISQTPKSVVVNRYESFEEAESMWTYFDLQSNHFVSNRMYQSADGSVAVTAMMSHEENQSAPDRGTGYNFCANGDMGSWNEMPEARVEGELRTGWPSIAQWGENGEIFVAHGAEGMYCFRRETAGQGEWEGPFQLPNPDFYTYNGQPIDCKPAWPRLATSGDNHEIIHLVADNQYLEGGQVKEHSQYYYRSTDGGENWTVTFGPLENDNEHLDFYTADDYAISANGHTVAILYSGSGGITGHVVIYKSTDDGLTWERRVVWENPYYGCDWETDSCSIFTDTLFGPSNGSVAVGNDGVVHVALNVYEYLHEAIGTIYTVFFGLAVDGIAYWNDTYEGPITSPDGNPHHALRLWWPLDGGYIAHREDDSIAFCGWIPPHPDTYWSEWNNEFLYRENDYFYQFHGASALPSIAVDPEGNVAVAYSSPDIIRDATFNGQNYFRTVFVSYKDADSDVWNIATDNLFEDFIHMMDEGTGVSAVSTPVHNNEFWFSYQCDDSPGFWVGNSASQTMASTNTIYVAKVSSEFVGIEDTEAKDVVYNIFPNPASDYIVVSSSMNADATVVFTNLAGQTIKTVNRNLITGDNSISINDLSKGIYFCTVTANGFSKTSKLVVK